jgi:arylesterase/paraoxonase
MKIFKISLLGLFILIAYLTIDIFIAAGSFKRMKPHFNGTTSFLELPVAGPEDITIDYETGIAFISADDRRANRLQAGSVEGAIFVLHLNDPAMQLHHASKTAPADFHPHGISLWKGNGRSFLFVVNHPQKIQEHTIERFEWRNDSLIHLETIRDAELLTSPNDVTAVGERTFYVTNDHGYSEPGMGRTLEDYLRLPLSYVNFFDGNSFRKVATHISYANGINHSADFSKIFVASPTEGKVFIYKRDVGSGLLTLQDEVDTDTGVDNIELDEAGALWIGCHPQLLKFVAHAKDAANPSPSQVIKLTPDNTGVYKAEEILLNDGTEYSGSTVAAVFGRKMLVGSVFEKKILVCTLPSN